MPPKKGQKGKTSAKQAPTPAAAPKRGRSTRNASASSAATNAAITTATVTTATPAAPSATSAAPPPSARQLRGQRRQQIKDEQERAEKEKTKKAQKGQQKQDKAGPSSRPEVQRRQQQQQAGPSRTRKQQQGHTDSGARDVEAPSAKDEDKGKAKGKGKAVAEDDSAEQESPSVKTVRTGKGKGKAVAKDDSTIGTRDQNAGTDKGKGKHKGVTNDHSVGSGPSGTNTNRGTTRGVNASQAPTPAQPPVNPTSFRTTTPSISPTPRKPTAGPSTLPSPPSPTPTHRRLASRTHLPTTNSRPQRARSRIPRAPNSTLETSTSSSKMGTSGISNSGKQPSTASQKAKAVLSQVQTQPSPDVQSPQKTPEPEPLSPTSSVSTTSWTGSSSSSSSDEDKVNSLQKALGFFSAWRQDVARKIQNATCAHQPPQFNTSGTLGNSRVSKTSSLVRQTRHRHHRSRCDVRSHVQPARSPYSMSRTGLRGEADATPPVIEDQSPIFGNENEERENSSLHVPADPKPETVSKEETDTSSSDTEEANVGDTSSDDDSEDGEPPPPGGPGNSHRGSKRKRDSEDHDDCHDRNDRNDQGRDGSDNSDDSDSEDEDAPGSSAPQPAPGHSPNKRARFNDAPVRDVRHITPSPPRRRTPPRPRQHPPRGILSNAWRWVQENLLPAQETVVIIPNAGLPLQPMPHQPRQPTARPPSPPAVQRPESLSPRSLRRYHQSKPSYFENRSPRFDGSRDEFPLAMPDRGPLPSLFEPIRGPVRGQQPQPSPLNGQQAQPSPRRQSFRTTGPNRQPSPRDKRVTDLRYNREFRVRKKPIKRPRVSPSPLHMSTTSSENEDSDGGQQSYDSSNDDLYSNDAAPRNNNDLHSNDSVQHGNDSNDDLYTNDAAHPSHNNNTTTQQVPDTTNNDDLYSIDFRPTPHNNSSPSDPFSSDDSLFAPITCPITSLPSFPLPSPLPDSPTPIRGPSQLPTTSRTEPPRRRLQPTPDSLRTMRRSARGSSPTVEEGRSARSARIRREAPSEGDPTGWRETLRREGWGDAIGKRKG